MKKHGCFLLMLCIVSLCFAKGTSEAKTAVQPDIDAHMKRVITVGNYRFKDLNGNGILDPYEDWRLPVDKRIEDLINKMTLEEKAGLMMIDTLNSDIGGKAGSLADNYVNLQNMRRFIFRNTVTDKPDNSKPAGWGGPQITAYEAALFTNTVQELAESSRLGIPVLFKSNARNHYDHDARAGINVTAGSFSAWPKEAGLAATRDMNLIKDFARIMRIEWNSIGLRGMYGYMADLATEPRWYRIHETFSENSKLNSEILSTLVTQLQGKPITQDSIVLTVKHFPGGGPQLSGLDPHYPYGREQSYTGGAFKEHWAPFKAAIDAGLTSIMPYYGIPVGMQNVYKPADDIVYDKNIGVGMAFNKGILEGLLRTELGFVGNVNSDTGIIGSRAWGLENYTAAQQIAIAVNAGTDVLSGYHDVKTVLAVIDKEKVLAAENAFTPQGISLERVNLACRRLLGEMFQLGLFENPFVDPVKAQRTVGRADYQRAALNAQKKSIVLLENKQILPLKPDTGIKVYVNNVNADVVKGYGFQIIDGTKGQSSQGADFALIRVQVKNKVAQAFKEDGSPYTYPDGQNVFTYFGGAVPKEVNMLSFSEMAVSQTWDLSPSLETIREVMKNVGAEKTVLSINFRQPYVLDEESGFRSAGAVFATFGVSDGALMDVITGLFKPQGKLPFALAKNTQAVKEQDADLPGYPEKDTLYPFGYGLTY